MKRKIFGLIAVAILSMSCIVGAQSPVTQHVAGGTLPGGGGMSAPRG